MSLTSINPEDAPSGRLLMQALGCPALAFSREERSWHKEPSQNCTAGPGPLPACASRAPAHTPPQGTSRSSPHTVPRDPWAGRGLWGDAERHL